MTSSLFDIYRNHYLAHTNETNETNKSYRFLKLHILENATQPDYNYTILLKCYSFHFCACIITIHILFVINAVANM